MHFEEELQRIEKELIERRNDQVLAALMRRWLDANTLNTISFWIESADCIK